MCNVKLDVLAEKLFEKISEDKTDIFKTKIVIIPSTKMEAYLKAYFLKNKKEVLMNVKFLTFNKAIVELFNTDLSIANKHQTISILINILKESNIKKFQEYLNCEDVLKGIKIYDIAKNLANLFMIYENQAIDFNANDNWKIDLYSNTLQLLAKNGLATVNYLYQYYKKGNLKFNDLGTIYIFGFIKENMPDLYKNIVEEYKNIELFYIENKNTNNKPELYLAKAPNKLREIENLHTNICNILLNDLEATFSDFLVVGTNMSDYDGEIERVFNQEGDYPDIPYYINAPKMRNNNIYNALNIMNRIINNQFYTREDFDDLINNNAIKFIRDITEEDINNFRRAIVDMNSYRKSDWDYAKKRLLLSKICDLNSDDNIVTLEKQYIPYSKIGLNDDSIYKFCKMVDDLNNLINVFNPIGKESHIISDINKLKNMLEALDRFLSKKDQNDIETNGYYIKIYDIFNFWIDNDITNIPTSTLIYMLIDASKNNIISKGELFTSGVSFTEFDTNTVLNAKYIFFINASSANLPVKKTRNPFDDKEINYDEEKNAFELWYKNASKRFYVSFVCRDLKKDEEFFLSNYVKELDEFNPTIKKVIEACDKKNKIFEEKNIDEKIDDHLYSIGIDENRPHNQIFTSRARKNKEYREGLVKGMEGSCYEIKDKTPQKSEEVSTSELGNYLYEPLTQKAKRLFGNTNDIEEKLEQEYEPFNLDGLAYYNLFIQIASKLLISKDDAFDADKADILKTLILKNALPNITINIRNKVFEKIVEDVIELKEFLTAQGNYDIITDLKELLLRDNLTIVNEKPFILIIDGNKRIYYPIKKKDGIKEKDYLTLYIISLMDIAKKNNKVTYEISICSGININDLFCDFKVNSCEALNKLIEIYEDYMNYSDNKYFGINLISIKTDKQTNITTEKLTVEKSLYELIDELDNNENWNKLKEKKLFDKYTELGYGNNLENELKKMCKKQKQLMLCAIKGDEQDA